MLAGVAKLGFVADLLSKPTQIGYMNGLALTILVSQLPKLFGFSVEGDGLIVEAVGFAKGLASGETVAAALAVGLLGPVLIGSLQRLVPKIPAMLMAVVVSILAANVFHLADHGVARVGRRAGAGTSSFQEDVSRTQGVRYPRWRRRSAPQRPGTSAFRRDRPMASIFKRVKDFAQSPKGEQVKEQVKEQASKPENRRKLKEFGQRYMKRR